MKNLNLTEKPNRYIHPANLSGSKKKFHPCKKLFPVNRNMHHKS